MTVNPNPYARRPAARPAGPDGLADVLERILDKGLVIAGDIQINLLDIELITIKVRLLLASADTAQQMGIDWWKHDPFLTSKDRELAQENEILRDRVDQLETAMGRKLVPGEPSPGDLWGEGAEDEGARRGQRLPTGAITNRQYDGAPSGGDGSATHEVEVDELILEHEGGGPGLRMTAGGASDAPEEEQHVEGVEELIIERGAGGPELHITAADLETLAEQDASSEEQAASDGAEPSPSEEEAAEGDGDEEVYWLDEESIASMTKTELQGELEARELDTSGNKASLRERLLDALEDEWETVAEDDSGDGSETADE